MFGASSDGFDPGWRYARGEAIYSVTDQGYMTDRFGICAMSNFFSWPPDLQTEPEGCTF